MKRAKILEQLIKEHGYGLRSFAAKCDMPYTSLYTILKRTGVSKASVEVVIRICKELGITVEEFEEKVNGYTSESPMLSCDDLEGLIARNGKRMTKDEKLRLIKLLSEL